MDARRAGRVAGWLVAVAATLPATASAGRISLDLALSCTPSEAMFECLASVRNSGEEAAVAPRLELRIGDATHSWEATDLSPGAEEVRSFEEALPAAARVAVLLRVRYRDANDYALSAVSALEAVIDGSVEPPVAGTFEASPLATRGRAVANLVSRVDEARSATISWWAPDELEFGEPSRVELGPLRSADIAVSIRNRSGLAGSSYPIFALVETKAEGRSITRVVGTTLTIVAPPQRPWLTWALLAALAGSVAAFALLQFRRR